ncbi:PaaI family thioesterase [Amycolatopsis sp.]|uniref:PaaI family thioesterase n=1 Tax=Amycolatopsis sp. TaxID=37632 RepID=UPI002D044CBE|nr:PaaI family thioesterase [Amycolatopsis sp.]HVV13176.1 PaaI family thioesterase [Amycolatopsis sp.]
MLLTGEALTARASQALAVPLQAEVGVRLLDESDPPAGVWFTVDGLAYNGFGGVHAAALQTALEVAAYLALLPQLTVDEHAITHALSTQLIAGAPVGERVEARGTLDRRGKRTAFLSVVASCDGRTVARGQLTKSVVPFG